MGFSRLEKLDVRFSSTPTFFFDLFSFFFFSFSCGHKTFSDRFKKCGDYLTRPFILQAWLIHVEQRNYNGPLRVYLSFKFFIGQFFIFPHTSVLSPLTHLTDGHQVTNKLLPSATSTVITTIYHFGRM